MNRRQRKFIRPDLQIRFILHAFLIAGTMLLVTYQLCHQVMVVTMVPVAETGIALSAIEDAWTKISWRFLVGLLLAIPLSACVGILYSFPFAGPCYKVKKYFTDLIAGRWDARCSLRKGDQLVDIAESVDDAMDVIRGFLREDRAVLAEVEEMLAKAGRTGRPEGPDAIEALRKRLRAAIAAHDERMPAASQESPALPVAPVPAPPTGAEVERKEEEGGLTLQP